MPPMPREEHENLLSELLTPDLEHTRRTEILQQLRADYTTVTTDHETMTKDVLKLRKDNEDLIVSNSKLFRQVGMVGNEPKQKEEESKEFSETITLESLEKGD